MVEVARTRSNFSIKNCGEPISDVERKKRFLKRRPARKKLAKLANFKSAKEPIKKELGQLDQLFSRISMITFRSMYLHLH